ncbi:hypothetical protein PAXRUDRAFT_28820, partial [Paxillus rubicundulus Ve08.2h10]
HFEDVLQCSLPAFEGLFPPEHNATIRILLFRLAELHALAKFRIHSDDSLARLDQALAKLSAHIHKFQHFTCTAFQTHELPGEAAARQRWQQAQAASSHHTNPTQSGGELARRLIKKFYGQTNRKDIAMGLATQERRLTCIRRQLESQTAADLDLLSSGNELLPELHHVMPAPQDNATNLAEFIHKYQRDPAVNGFIPKLKDHILSRLQGFEYDGDEHHFTDIERNDLRFVNNLNQDIIRPGHSHTVMTLLREDGPSAHPFCRSLQIVESLWVCWLGVEPGYCWGLREAHLPKIRSFPESDENTFGFLDPSLVIRRCHLIPAFHGGRTDTLLRHGPSLARQPEETDDWSSFYVNINSFTDRHMFCHFAGLGIGHEIQYPMQPGSGAGGDDEEVNNNEVDDNEAMMESEGSGPMFGNNHDGEGVSNGDEGKDADNSEGKDNKDGDKDKDEDCEDLGEDDEDEDATNFEF